MSAFGDLSGNLMSAFLFSDELQALTRLPVALVIIWIRSSNVIMWGCVIKLSKNRYKSISYKV